MHFSAIGPGVFVPTFPRLLLHRDWSDFSPALRYA